jgi:hypothetical protein
MTRRHAAKRLLEHGPLTWGELMAITGWSYNTLRGAMCALMEQGDVVAEPYEGRLNIYRLA